MKGSRAFLNHQSNQVANLLDSVKRTSQTAAATDEAGRWGVDGWIRVFHDLFDMQLRAVAMLTEATIEGPWWLLGPDREPFECDKLTALTSRGYAREISITAALRRLGTEETISFDELTFEPATLAPGQVEFTITATSGEKVGSNFTGELRFVEASPKPGHDPRVQKQPITIGL